METVVKDTLSAARFLLFPSVLMMFHILLLLILVALINTHSTATTKSYSDTQTTPKSVRHSLSSTLTPRTVGCQERGDMETECVITIPRSVVVESNSITG